MGDEGCRYICKWTKLADGTIESWVRRYPKIRVSVKDQNDLIEKLAYAIEDQLGDCEPQIEFEPELPTAGLPPGVFDAGHVWLSSLSHCNINISDASGFFDGGICPKCAAPIGKRSSQKLTFSSAWPGDSLGTVADRTTLQQQLVSEKAATFLREISLTGYQLHDVQLPPGKRKRFLEVRPETFLTEVSVRGLPLTGGNCSGCGRSGFSHNPHLDICLEFVAESAMPAIIPPIFFLGIPSVFHVCVRGDVWRERKADFRRLGWTSSQLGVLKTWEIGEVPTI